MKIRRKTKTAGRAKNFSLPAGAVDLTKMLETLKPHDHLCLIYESHKEWRAAVVPFISIGLRRGEKCAYIIDTSTADEIRKYLREEGVDVASAEKSGQLFILPEIEAYTREDSFDPDRMIALLISETEKAIAEGYPAFRVTAEMSWVLRGHLGSEKLLEYEAKLNRDLFPKYPCLAICQYDRWKFNPEIIKGVIMTHPLLVRSNNIYHNIYYIPPEEFLTQKRADAEVQHWLNNLEREKRMWEELRQSEIQLKGILESTADGILAVDNRGKVIRFNCRFAEMWRIPRELMDLGDDDALLAHVFDQLADPEVFMAKVRELYGSDKEDTSIILFKDGRVFERFSSPLILEGSIVGRIWSFRDITERKRAEEELRQGNERFQLVCRGTHDAVWDWDLQTNAVWWNENFQTLFGYRAEEIEPGLESWTNRIHPEDLDRVVTGIHAAIDAGKLSWSDQYRFRHKDGSYLEIYDRGYILREANGRAVRMIGAMQDIAERKRAEEALRESEAKYSTVVEAAIDGIAIVQDGLIKFANKALEKMSGYNHQEIIDKPLVDFLHLADGEKALQRIAERIEGKPISGAFEVRYLSKNGMLNYLEAQGNVIQYNAKPADLVFIRDITERKKAEEALRESEERFRTLYENSTLGLYRTTPDGRILLANPTLVRMLGYSSFDDLSTRDLEKNGFEPSYPRAQFVEIIEKKGEVRGFESAWKRKDGTTVFVRESARAIRDSQGKTLYYDGTVEDITERKRAEEALRESEEKYRNLVEYISDVIYAIDGGGTITYVSPVVKSMFGYEPDELIGRPFMELVYKEDQSILTNRFLDLQRGIIKYAEYRMIDKQGEIKWVRTLTNPIIERGVFVGARGTLIDITERKRAEEALQRSEENFRRSLDDSPLGVRIVTVEGETVYANRAILDIYGYDSIEELRATPLKRRYTPESYAEQQIRMEKRNRGEYDPSEYEIGIIRKNGEVRHLQVFRKEVLWNGERQFQVIYRDITEQKKAEEKITASLMEKEVLLREIHHRVKNNMQIISSLLRLQSRSIEDEKMREIFNESQSRIRSMSLIHEKLYESKDFSRIDFSDYIGKMVTHLFVVYRVNTADVRFKVEAKGIYLDITKAIPCGLVINELVSNALKYAFAEGKKGDMIIRMNKDKNGKYHLSVKDTGIGVSPDFDIRKTETLGFQIVNDLVRQISGTIELKRDKGTEFRIVF